MVDALLDRLGRAEGYVGGALLLAAAASALLLAGRIDATTWQATVLGVWGAVVVGGAAAAYRPK